MLLLLTACVPNDCNLRVPNDVAPREDVPAELVDLSDGESVWLTKWDNPPVTGFAGLTPYQSAERVANEWFYADLDLVATIDPPWANPAPSGPNPDDPRVLFAWPQQPRMYPPQSLLFWEAYGLALPPRVSKDPYEGIATVQSLRTDDYIPNTYDPYHEYYAHKKPGLFQLDPDVPLVPLKTVVLYIPGDPSYDKGWLSKPYLQSVFDDYWTGTKEIKTYGLGLWGAAGEWQYGCDDGCSVPNVQPDRVWDQCDIQFRVVKYHECPVSHALFWDDKTHPCDLDQMHENVKEALMDCPGFDLDDELSAVVFKGELVPNTQMCVYAGGPTYGVPGFTSIHSPYKWAYLRMSGSGLLLTHELGHLLELDDNSCSLPHTIMCSLDPQPEIGNVCEGTRGVARHKQDAYWTP